MITIIVLVVRPLLLADVRKNNNISGIFSKLCHLLLSGRMFLNAIVASA